MKVKKIQFIAVLLSVSYIVVAAPAYKRVFDDAYYGELIRHGQTTEQAVIPFYMPQPIGGTGFQRRALNLFEYPAINLSAVSISIYFAVLLLFKGVGRVRKLARYSKFGASTHIARACTNARRSFLLSLGNV